MSTLKVDTLLNAAGNQSPISVPGAAKAWVNFNGTGSSATIRDSFNVDSVTDNAIGDYTITLTNALGNSDYCIQVCATDDGSAAGQTDGYAYGSWLRGANSAVLTASSARIQLGHPANAVLSDQSHVMVTFFGD